MIFSGFTALTQKFKRPDFLPDNSQFYIKILNQKHFCMYKGNNKNSYGMSERWWLASLKVYIVDLKLTICLFVWLVS